MRGGGGLVVLLTGDLASHLGESKTDYDRISFRGKRVLASWKQRMMEMQASANTSGSHASSQHCKQSAPLAVSPALVRSRRSEVPRRWALSPRCSHATEKHLPRAVSGEDQREA